MFTISKTNAMFTAVKMAWKILATCNDPDTKIVYVTNSCLYATDSKRMIQATFAADVTLPEPGGYTLVAAGSAGYILQPAPHAPKMYDVDRIIKPVLANPYQTITADDKSYVVYRCMRPRNNLSMLLNVDFVLDAWDTFLQPQKLGKEYDYATVHLYSSSANMPLGLASSVSRGGDNVDYLYLIMPMILPPDELTAEDTAG